MWHIYNHKRLLLVLIILSISGCAYFNTFYNAQQYFKEAEKIRLTKDGKSISVSAMDKYGKTVKKCETILSDYPDSKYIIDARLLMGKARYYRSEYDLGNLDEPNDLFIIDGMEKELCHNISLGISSKRYLEKKFKYLYNLLSYKIN